MARHVGLAMFAASVCGSAALAQTFSSGTPPLPSPQTSANRLSDSLATPNPLTPSALSPDVQSSLSGKNEETVPSRRIPAPRAPIAGEAKRVTPDIWHPDTDTDTDLGADSEKGPATK